MPRKTPKPAPKPKKKRKPRIAGRQPEITAEQITQLETLLSNCTTVKTACEATGVSVPTFYRWLDMADQEDSKFPVYKAFRERITRARGLAKATLVKTIVAQAPTDWRAAAELLKALAPDEYGTKERVDVKVQGAVQHDHTHKQIVLVMPAAIAQPRPIRQIEARKDVTYQPPENPAP